MENLSHKPYVAPMASLEHVILTGILCQSSFGGKNDNYTDDAYQYELN